MTQKRTQPRERKIGKKQQDKKSLIDPKYKNTVWTVIVIAILLIFFIVNNTRSVPDNGPYPPGYNPSAQSKPDAAINPNLQMDTHIKK
jgi:hypothetical protein